MFKLFSLLIALTVLASSSLFAKGWMMPANDLPQRSAALIMEAYPDAQIWSVERKIKKDGERFNVRLSNGAKIDFLVNGDWMKIDGKYNTVPFRVLPNAVANSIRRQYPEAAIVKLTKEWGNYKIKLNNMMELYISSTGDLIGQKMND